MSDPSNASAMSAPRRDAANEVRAATAEDWDGTADVTEPDALPDAWIGLLFALLVTVFTVAAAWNWLGA